VATRRKNYAGRVGHGGPPLQMPIVPEELYLWGFVQNYGNHVVTVRLVFNAEHVSIRAGGACDLTPLA